MQNENDDDPFNKIMEKVGYGGRFQKIYTVIFVMALTAFGALANMNLILALNVPDHWCHIPGIEKTNLTLNEWRTVLLPRKKDNRGEDKFSSCEMYNISTTQIQNWNYENWNFSKTNTINCTNGWEYDREWYDESVPTQENWVCEYELYVTNTFVVSRVAEVVGLLVFGQMGDVYGRRIVYYMSVILAVAGRVISIVTASSFVWFISGTILSQVFINSLFQSPLIVAMEISRDDERTNIAMLQSFGWSTATSLLPLIYWWLRHWEPFMWLTTLPAIAVLFCYKYMIESPRWLISKKKFNGALKQFKTMAKINGRQFDMSEKEIAAMFSNMEEETVYGLASLFSAWRIARNTLITGFSWCVVAVSFFTLVLFSSRMGGNPFLNFLLQSIVEVPSYVVGKYLTDSIGRRVTNCLAFILSGIVCIPIILMATEKDYEAYVLGLAAFIKFLNGLTYFAVNLQSMEIYPTCLRQTGISLGAIVANAVGTLAPYFVYLGTSTDIRYPYYILCFVFFMGGILGSFLPETLHTKLPDTLEEAKNFGEKQKFWSLPKAAKHVENDSPETEKLNKQP